MPKSGLQSDPENPTASQAVGFFYFLGEEGLFPHDF